MIANNNNDAVRISLSDSKAARTEAAALVSEAEAAAKKLLSGDLPYSGWVNYASSLSEAAVGEIEAAAVEIASRSDYVVSVGIGGSYLGARAAQSFLGEVDGPELLFAGYNLSGAYHAQLLEKIKHSDFSVIIISKSGGTLEPGAAFAALKKLLVEKYGESGAYSRIYAVTDASSGKLKTEADANGYKSFVLPSDIGGRYSVLSPVGLLPLAAAGYPVRELLAGAADAEDEKTLRLAQNIAAARAVIGKEKSVVTLNYFEPCLADFADWLQQLFGESEGKDGLGVLPVPLAISTDLHSVGQFLQEGKQVFYEMNLLLEHSGYEISFDDGDGEYAGRSYSEFNRAVHAGMSQAHTAVGIPIIDVSIKDRSAHTLGHLIYLFELICSLTALLMGVNPFDQPGVEAYKAGMNAYLLK